MAKFLTHATANDVLDGLLLVGVEVALYTTAPTQSGGGTEVVGGSYARQPVTMSAAASSASSNTNTVTFTNMPACTVVAVALHNADTDEMVWVNDGVSITCAAGSNKQFPIGDIDAAFVSAS